MQSQGWHNVPALHRQRQEIVKQQMNLLPHRLFYAAIACFAWGATMLSAIGAYSIYEESTRYASNCIHYCRRADWASEYALDAACVMVCGITVAFLSLAVCMILRTIEGKKFDP